MSDAAVMSPPEVDLPPPQAPIHPMPATPPIPPPAPPATPSFNAIAKRFMGQGTPVTQETTTRQTVYPGLPGGNALDMPGANKKSMPCIQYMADIAQDPNCSEYVIEVSRVKPAIHMGQRFPFGVIERFPPFNFRDVHDQVREVHGGGTYNIRVLNDEGRQVHAMQFSIEIMSCPPILRVPNAGYGAVGTSPGVLGPGAFAAIGGEEDDLRRLRAEEQRARAEEQVLISKNRVAQTQRNIEKAARREQEEEERKMMGPQNEEARLKLNELRHETDNRFNMMNSSFEKLVLMMANQKPADNGIVAIMPLFVEMMKSSTQQMTALMTAMISGGGNKANEMANIMQMQNASQEKLFTVMMNSATASSAKSEKLIEQVFLHKLDQPDSALKQALDMQERGRKDAMQMWQMIEEARGDREDGDVISPDSGFFGNMGNLILHGLKNLVSGAARGGGKQAMELLSGILQKPAGTTQFSEQDLQTAAAKIEATRRPALAALPPPQQQNMPAAPAPGPVVRPKPKLFDKVYEIVDSQPTVITPPPPVAMPVPTPAPAPIPVVEVQVQSQGTMIETVDAVRPPQSAVVETTGDEFVNEAIALAVSDLRAGRREHEWVDFALGKWGRDYLTQIAQAADDAGRIQLLQSQADPELFRELIELLMDANKPQNYRDFIENLNALREGALEGALSVAA